MPATMICSNPQCGYRLETAGTSSVPCPVCQSAMTISFQPSPPGDTLDLPKDSDQAVAESMPSETLDLSQNSSSVPATPNTPSATQEHPEIPKRIGRFLIRERIGEGTFGIVYLAHDPQLDRAIALKVARQNKTDKPEHVERFYREARAAANLRHPHIVPLHETGRDGEFYYIASSYIRGQTLEHLLAGEHPNGLPMAKAIRIVRQLAEAVGYAHAQGIIHRDIKSANIMIDEQGEPLLLDFGLAARTGTGEERFTQDKVQMGTPAYMSPEQWYGDQTQVGPASDQYALGCVLYEILTGHTPFEGNSALQMTLHLKQEPKPLRQVRADVPRDLETICTKTLEKEPQRRYADCQALADDLRRFQEGEPTLARPLRSWEKFARWVKKNPQLAGMGLLFFLTLITGVAVSLRYAQKANQALAVSLKSQQERVLSQVETLLTADPKAVPTILTNLEQSREQVLPRLQQIWDEPETATSHSKRLRAALALLPIQTEMVRDYLLQGMLTVPDPSELIVIRDALKPYMASGTDSLWKQLEDKDLPSNQRLRIVAALAAWDANHPGWDVQGEGILQPWLSDNPLYLGTWTEALRPVRVRLIPALQKVYRGEQWGEWKYVAANLLADYGSDQADELAVWIRDGDDRQFGILYPVLEKHRAKVIAFFQKELAQVPKMDEPPEDQTIATWKPIFDAQVQQTLAKHQSSAALALLRLGESKSVWSILQSSAYPEARTRAIHRMATTGIKAQTLLEQLKVEKDVGIRRGLILALGEYREDQIPIEPRQEIIELLLQWYRQDPDAGIHGAIDWLLRPEKDGLQDRPLRLGQREKLEAYDRQFAEVRRTEQIAKMVLALAADQALAASISLLVPEPKVSSGSWWVNGQGQTFTVVESREPWLMGSPVNEPERIDANEVLHWRKIDRKFAIATKSVSVGEFERFQQANPQVEYNYTKKYAPEKDCPAITITWYDAIAYCRWLSEIEGIPETEMVYPKVEVIEKAKQTNAPLQMPKDYLKRKGYRLPTESEWEYAARNGTRSVYHFGSSVDWLGHYCWYTSNTKDQRSYPVGQKKPNEWGLFDMTGNVLNCMQDPALLYPPGTKAKPARDTEFLQSITDSQLRVLRGGAFDYLPQSVRSSIRIFVRPTNRLVNVGLRLSRTFD